MTIHRWWSSLILVFLFRLFDDDDDYPTIHKIIIIITHSYQPQTYWWIIHSHKQEKKFWNTQLNQNLVTNFIIITTTLLYHLLRTSFFFHYQLYFVHTTNENNHQRFRWNKPEDYYHIIFEKRKIFFSKNINIQLRIFFSFLKNVRNTLMSPPHTHCVYRLFFLSYLVLHTGWSDFFVVVLFIHSVFDRRRNLNPTPKKNTRYKFN